ncbi:MAG: magnesium transporter [Acidobacteria bacterium]|nr:magnesium transporter [Acidobacteriota bacterium]
MSIDAIDLHDSVLDHIQTDVVRLHPEQTVGHALEALRARAASLEIVYVYVVDEGGRLLGVVPTRALLASQPERPLREIVQEDVVAIPDWATVLVAAEYFVTQRFLAFPVVSADGVLAGQVDVSVFTDEVVGHAKRSFDDIFQIIGVHATQGRTVWLGFRDRFPWLLTNMAGGMLCALLASQYEALLDAAVVLALFVPMVLALAESVSMQSVTLTLQGLHSSGITWALLGPALRRELGVAALLGLSSGALVGGVAWAWKGSPVLALAVGGAIAASMVTAAVLGLVLPTLLHAARRDAKIAAGPIVLATADLCTLLIYFNLAAVFV